LALAKQRLRNGQRAQFHLGYLAREHGAEQGFSVSGAQVARTVRPAANFLDESRNIQNRLQRQWLVPSERLILL